MAPPNGNVPATREAAAAPAKANRNDFRSLIEGSADRLADVIPAMMKKHLTPERIIRLSLAAFSRKEELRKCEPLSILNSIIQAVQLGFEPDGPLGRAYLVPYAGQCSLQIGYKGFTDLARRTAGYDLIDSRLIHERDEFLLEYDPAPVFRHRPNLAGDPGKVVHAYAYAYLKGSDRPIFEIMSSADIAKIRNGSKSKNSPAWRDHEGEMQKKVVLKRMLKDQPLSIELADALAYDNDLNGSVDVRRSAPASVGMAGLKERMQIGHAPADEPDPEPAPAGDLTAQDIDELAEPGSNG